ncbi:MAG: hypothetical protein LBR10_00145 [Prevotellaceae bacterium]|jgi:hypothetical protein|nr:hypothetical protein [Prevotellaceae bacterium]
MANERKTEQIVRAHFERYGDIIRLEEQSSDTPKIDKLLKTASKKGIGKGRPEFIITFNKNSDLLIVVECKADIVRHESQNRDKFLPVEKKWEGNLPIQLSPTSNNTKKL